MSKGAIAIFAFSIFFISCAAPVTTQPPLPSPPTSLPTPSPSPPLPSHPSPLFPLPDLTISDLFLTETNEVVVVISNRGEGVAPPYPGRLMIYVDGYLRWERSLKNLFDQTFLQPGESVTYTTPIVLTGSHDVRAILEDEEKGVEEIEGTNHLTKVIVKEKRELPPVFLPDLTIHDLFLTPQRRLAVTVANIGESPFALGAGNLKIYVDGTLKGSYTFGGLSDQSVLPTKGSITFTTPLTLVGRHEIVAQVDSSQGIKESNEGNNRLKKHLEGLPIGPDIVVKELELTDDLDLTIILSNAGETDLRKGVTFRIRVILNGRKVSEFDHFISEALRAHFGNRYLIDPPYRVGISGISKVKVSISPKLSSDDIRLENNTLERTFVLFPFKIGPQGRDDFSFSFPFFRPQGEGQAEKMKVEARWEGSGSSLMLMFKKSGDLKGIPTLSGKSPLKMEFPLFFGEGQKESIWSVFVANLADKKAEGYLIIQHP